MIGRPLLRIFVAAALAVILTAVLPFVLGCSALTPTRPASAPANDKGTPPPLYQPGLSDEVAETETADQTGWSGGEMESPNEPIAPKI